MNAFMYLLQVNIYLVMFLGFYWIALKNETFFKPNRIYLNSTAVLSFIIPYLNPDLIRELVITEKVREVSVIPMQEVVYQPVIIRSEPSAATPADVLTIIYLAGAAFFLVRFAIQLSLLRRTISGPLNGAFSFFGKLSVAPGLEQRDTILRHEQVHVRQWHSFDVILMEIVAVINWFNPVIYLYRTEIKHIHEFIADEEASAGNKENYAMLLLSNTFGVPAHHLTNSFFNQSLLKRRIYMLSKNRSQRTKLLKYGLCAPVFIAMLILSSASISRSATELTSAGSGRDDRTEARESNYAFLNQNPAVEGVRWSKGGRVVEILLKNGKTDRYDLEKTADVERIASVYRAVPVPPPSEDTIPDGVPEDYRQFLKRNPGVERVSWRPDAVIIILKNGATETYDVRSDADREKLTKKYGELPAAPPAPPKGDQGNQAGAQDELYDFSRVEVLPKFPGGDAAFGKYLKENLKYPAEAREKKISGRVFVTFVVGKDGSLSDIRVRRDLGYGTGEEAVRVLEGSPKWTPGMMDGKPVRVEYTTVIFFELGGGKPAGNQPHDGNDEGPDEAVDFTEAGQLPQFPGGGQGFAKFLSEHIRYPAEARANKITGRVFARFIVEKDGSLSDIKILRGLGFGTEEETLRVLKLSPRWTAGTKAGKPVRVTYTIPVSYELGTKWDPAILKDTQKLFVLDGRTVRPGDLEDLAADRIREISILAASEAKKAYGRSGKNGAVVITTKKP